MNNGYHNQRGNGYDEETHPIYDDPRYRNQNPGRPTGPNNNGYNNGFNQPPRPNNSSRTLLIGIGAAIALCLIVVLVIFLIGQNKKLDALQKQVTDQEQVDKKSDKKSDDKAEKRSKKKEYGVFSEGNNTFAGTFNYAGADYGFKVRFKYDPSTNTASNVKYEADGYDGTIKMSSMDISSDGSEITIMGKSTYIDVSGSPDGTYSGTMRRGNHDGTCTMRIR